MYRPDTPLLRRALKNDKFVLGALDDTDAIIEHALHLPLIALSHSESSKFFGLDTPEPWVRENIFDEFVLFYQQDIKLIDDRESLPSGLQAMRDHISANPNVYAETTATVWSAFLRWDNPVLMKYKKYPKSLDAIRTYAAENGFHRSAEEIQEHLFFNYTFVQYKKLEHSHYLYAAAGWIQATDDGKHGFGFPIPDTLDFWGDDMEGLMQQMLNSQVLTHKLNYYAKYGEKHLVEVAPSKPRPRTKTPLNVKKPWKSATGPHILFLDKMPTTAAEGYVHQGGTKSPHRRRGHWRTLEHPRYRHHPNFGQQIYVKPSFVGPQQTEYEGNIYKLIQPLDEIGV